MQPSAAPSALPAVSAAVPSSPASCPRSSSKPQRLPRLGVHAATGQARVVIEGRTIYLGKAGPNAHERYRELIGVWLTTGRLPDEAPAPAPSLTPTIGDLVARFLEAKDGYYRSADGEPTLELDNFVIAFGPLLARYGLQAAEQFSPRRLKDVQEAMVRKGWCRVTVNRHLGRVKALFKWATAEELVPASVYHGLQAVDGLRRYRSTAPEPAPVLPVPERDYDATLPHLTPTVRAMVELQYLTGMRVSEVRLMRMNELDRTAAAWRYVPRLHKTAHFGKQRIVPLGPKAQAILKPWLKLSPNAALFSPEEAERRRFRAKRKQRKTKVPPSQLLRTQQRAEAERLHPPGEVYTVAAYRRAIERACKRAKVESWAPARLRHNAAERIRREFGVEVARCVLGHSDIRTTQLYSSMDEAKALDAAMRVG
ncbi:MAG: site-specific integrase [Planctomycetes bacterium]|nr:site-specific integrase [Planctomycetota bacterium]